MTLPKWREEIERAVSRVRNHVRHTPLEPSIMLSGQSWAKVYIKLECEQLTGSFKIRGAFNKILKLNDSGKLHTDRGPTFASKGNHALACNVALNKLGVKGKTYVPTTINSAKEFTLRKHGAHIIKFGAVCMESELEARRVAEVEGRPYMSPYNDCDIIAGQGTIGYEIFEDLPEVDAVFVPVGGGGLIGGIAAYLKAVKPNIKIVGCQPFNSKVMYESVQAGSIIYDDSIDTLSDGTAGGIEQDAVTFDLCRDLVDEWVMVSEKQIADAVYFMVEHHHKIVEGATGLSVGAFIQTADKYKDKHVVIIACGSNIGVDKLRDILNSKTS